MRLNRGLRQYEMQFNPGWAFKGRTGRQCAEFEAVLDCTKVTSTLAQKETGFNGAFTPLIKSLALTKLRADESFVIDMPKVTASPNVPRMAVKMKTCPHGADSKGEGNTGGREAVVRQRHRGAHWGPRQHGQDELLCTLLDKRTLGCHHITAEQRKEAYQVSATSM